jgi:hypothetical protein
MRVPNPARSADFYKERWMMNESNSISLKGEGAPNRIVVKFNFTNRVHIPAGIPEKARGTDKEVDARHAQDAIKSGDIAAAEVGKERAGRVDTGIPVIKNLEMVQVAMLRQGFARAKYLLADCHYYRHAVEGKQTKFVVCLTFRRLESVEGIPPLPSKTVEAMRDLARTTWGFAHVWSNPNGVVTINMVSRKWDSRGNCYEAPAHALTVRNGMLAAEEVEQEVSEEAE